MELKWMDSAHKTFRPTDLTSTYSICTRRVFGGTGIEPRPSGLESGALTPRLPTALKITPPPGGLEPPTFQLTAERASRLCHYHKTCSISVYLSSVRFFNVICNSSDSDVCFSFSDCNMKFIVALTVNKLEYLLT
ncbi:hypothetical protein TNCV_3086461 [Trichonephila clavipes]|nr:hypothetical protein TNCV_3086461 [Trichonephila clavipes]